MTIIIVVIIVVANTLISLSELLKFAKLNTYKNINFANCLHFE